MNESELRTRSMSSQPDANKPVRIVELKQTDTDAAAHIHLVAARMRQTLIEVLGQERGPRFGSFVAIYGIPETRALIGRALRGELAGAGEQAS